MRAPAAKLPQLNEDMTLPQFRKFTMDWDVFKRITNLPEYQIHTQLYNACESVQNSLVNTESDFFSLTEDKMTQTLEKIVTKDAIQLSISYIFDLFTNYWKNQSKILSLD